MGKGVSQSGQIVGSAHLKIANQARENVNVQKSEAPSLASLRPKSVTGYVLDDKMAPQPQSHTHNSDSTASHNVSKTEESVSTLNDISGKTSVAEPETPAASAADKNDSNLISTKSDDNLAATADVKVIVSSSRIEVDSKMQEDHVMEKKVVETAEFAKETNNDNFDIKVKTTKKTHSLVNAGLETGSASAQSIVDRNAKEISARLNDISAEIPIPYYPIHQTHSHSRPGSAMRSRGPSGVSTPVRLPLSRAPSYDPSTTVPSLLLRTSSRVRMGVQAELGGSGEQWRSSRDASSDGEDDEDEFSRARNELNKRTKLEIQDGEEFNPLAESEVDIGFKEENEEEVAQEAEKDLEENGEVKRAKSETKLEMLVSWILGKREDGDGHRQGLTFDGVLSLGVVSFAI